MIRRLSFFLVIFCLPVLVFAQTDPRLINGDMSGEFAPQGDYKAVPEGWTFFVSSGSANSDRYTWPPHALSKPISWKIASRETTFEAGGYQQVEATPGTTYTFTGHAFLWTCSDTSTNCIRDNQRYSTTESGAQARVGIDPTGGTDPTSADIVWSEWASSFDQYAEMTIEAAAEADQITVFIWVDSGTAMAHNEAYWDDLSLTAGDAAPAATSVPASTDEAPEPTLEATATSSSALIAPPPANTLAAPATTIPATPIATEVSAALTTETVICTTFFEDVNQNGWYDANEPALPGSTVMIGDAPYEIETLDQCSEPLEPGIVEVAAAAPAGYGITTPAEYQVQVSLGQAVKLTFGAAQGFTPPPTPIPAQETLTAPEPITRRTVIVVEEEQTPLEEAFDYSAYIVLGLAAAVLLGGMGLLLLLRSLR